MPCVESVKILLRDPGLCRIAPPAEVRAARRKQYRRQYLSWKVRYRTLLRFSSQMIKLYRARSLLYRRQILKGNIRWKALDEIYKIYMLLHRSDLNISEKNRQTFSHFSAKVCKIYSFSKKFHWILLRIRWNFIGISQIFSKMLKKLILNFLNFPAKYTEFCQNFDRTLM